MADSRHFRLRVLDRFGLAQALISELGGEPKKVNCLEQKVTNGTPTE